MNRVFVNPELVTENYVVAIAMSSNVRVDFVTAFLADTPAARGRPPTVEMIRRARKGA